MNKKTTTIFFEGKPQVIVETSVGKVNQCHLNADGSFKDPKLEASLKKFNETYEKVTGQPAIKD